MSASKNLQSLFIIGSLLVAAVTLAKHGPWFVSDWGLTFLFVTSSIVLIWRWKLLKRQKTPETRGNLKTIKSTDIHRIKLWLAKNIVGQGQSIHSILQILKRNVELVDRNRHLGSFLLVGPTGTGKTFMAQLLAEGLYGSSSLISIAMNQDGLRGENIVEILLTALKKNPNRVVLFDEIDKAPAVHASLYHFLESGQLMDPQTGEWFHCPGLVVVATTNAGSHAADEAMKNLKNSYGMLEHISSNSRMEKAFLSRFEGILWFGELAPMEIAHVGLAQVTSYYNQHGVSVSYVDPGAIIEIVKENMQFKQFGVRQLIQVVRHKSDPIIAQARRNGWKAITISVDPAGNLIPGSLRPDRMVS